MSINPEEFRAKQQDPRLKPYLSIHRNDAGLATLEGKGQVLVPAPFIQTSLSLAHDTTAHQGHKKMLARIEPHYWWPKQKTEIENYVKSCKRCGATPAQGYRNAPIHQRPREVKQFALIEVDLKGTLPRTKEGYDNIVVMADPTTKYAEMHPIRGETSEVVCRVIKGWISRYGLPKKLHSDNGQCFVSTSFQQFCADHGIEHTLSPPYRPQANAGVERINRTRHGRSVDQGIEQTSKEMV